MKLHSILFALALAIMAGPVHSEEQVKLAPLSSIDLKHYANEYGDAAGNDLANEIVSRLHQKGVEYDAARTRALCKKAVSDLLDERLLVAFRAFNGARKGLIPIGSPVKRRLELDLPEGFKWNEEVVIRFEVDPANSRAGDPNLPDKMFVWMEFELSDAISGTGKMTVSGAASLRAEKKAEQGGSGQPATRSESKSEAGDKPLPKAEGRSR